MSKIISLDIETAVVKPVPEDMLTFIRTELKPDARLTDPAKIEENLQKKMAARLSGLNPYVAQIICVCIASKTEDSPQADFLDSWYGVPEHMIIEGLMRKLEGERQAGCNLIVTFNGKEFDIPFILLRSSLYNLELPLWFNWGLTGWRNNKVYSTFNISHLDIRDVIGRDQGTLDEIRSFYGYGLPDIRGHEVQDLYDNGDIESIVAKCSKDTINTLDIAERLHML